jgi:hypothetical protein
MRRHVAETELDSLFEKNISAMLFFLFGMLPLHSDDNERNRHAILLDLKKGPENPYGKYKKPKPAQTRKPSKEQLVNVPPYLQQILKKQDISILTPPLPKIVTVSPSLQTISLMPLRSTPEGTVPAACRISLCFAAQQLKLASGPFSKAGLDQCSTSFRRKKPVFSSRPINLADPPSSGAKQSPPFLASGKRVIFSTAPSSG